VTFSGVSFVTSSWLIKLGHLEEAGRDVFSVGI